MITIRRERPEDRAAIHEINRLAFDGPVEADLVDALREAGAMIVSLVAEERDEPVGHICFSPVAIDGRAAEPPVAALGPMAVRPGRQRRGIGTALARAGLDAVRAAGHPAVVVLGHPAFYPRFGFSPASRWRLRFPAPVPDEVFMALELVPGALDGPDAVVRYRSEFDGA